MPESYFPNWLPQIRAASDAMLDAHRVAVSARSSLTQTLDRASEQQKELREILETARRQYDSILERVNDLPPNFLTPPYRIAPKAVPASAKDVAALRDEIAALRAEVNTMAGAVVRRIEAKIVMLLSPVWMGEPPQNDSAWN